MFGYAWPWNLEFILQGFITSRGEVLYIGETVCLLSDILVCRVYRHLVCYTLLLLSVPVGLSNSYANTALPIINKHTYCY